MLAKNLVMLAHNLVIVVVVLAFLPPASLSTIWLAPVGLALVIANLLWIVLLLGMLSARFRDIPRLVVIASHDHAIIADQCNIILKLEHGKIVSTDRS